MSADFECSAGELGSLGISPKDAEECKRVFEFSGAEGCRRYLEKKQEEWKNVPMNVAVIGNSGVGKSSFINAIRRMTAEHEESATVSVTETTSDIRDYPHPANQMLKFWDLPGVGTPRFPRDEYVEAIDIERYDFFLLLSATRFTENDVWLGNEITKIFRKYYYVRTKVAADIYNNKQAYPTTHDDEAVIQKIRENIAEQLRVNGSENTPVFLVDNYKTQKFDFSKLEQNLINDFPEKKRTALILSMSAYNRGMVQRKVGELRGGIWRVATTSAAVAAVPVPGLSIVFDISLVWVQIKFYFKQLGLDDDSLRNHAAITQTDFSALKEIVARTLDPTLLTVEGVKVIVDLLPKATFIYMATAVEEVSRKIPFFGSLIAAPLSFGGTYYMLKCVLDLLEKVALDVVTYVEKHTANRDEDDED